MTSYTSPKYRLAQDVQHLERCLALPDAKKYKHEYCHWFSCSKAVETKRCGITKLWATHSPMRPDFDRRMFNIYEGKV